MSCQLEINPDGTYNAPRWGWTCFHCGLHFEQSEEDLARAHFGATPDVSPLCIDRARWSPAELAERARKAEDAELEAIHERNRAEDRQDQLELELADWRALNKRLGGVAQHIETLEGRALAAEAIIAAAARMAPAAIEAARAAACAPLTGQPERDQIRAESRALVGYLQERVADGAAPIAHLLEAAACGIAWLITTAYQRAPMQFERDFLRNRLAAISADMLEHPEAWT